MGLDFESSRRKVSFSSQIVIFLHAYVVSLDLELVCFAKFCHSRSGDCKRRASLNGRGLIGLNPMNNSVLFVPQVFLVRIRYLRIIEISFK